MLISRVHQSCTSKSVFFLYSTTATTELYTLSLHDALPIYKLHQTYYAEEQKHPIVLEDSVLEECAYEGMRQSRIESNVVILSFLGAVVSFIIFFQLIVLNR